MVEAPSSYSPTVNLSAGRRTNVEFCIRPTGLAVTNFLYRFRLVALGNGIGFPGPLGNMQSGYGLKLIERDPLGDVNRDGVVNQADLNLVISNFGNDYR
jgi:hypothetical protein